MATNVTTDEQSSAAENVFNGEAYLLHPLFRPSAGKACERLREIGQYRQDKISNTQIFQGKSYRSVPNIRRMDVPSSIRPLLLGKYLGILYR